MFRIKSFVEAGSNESMRSLTEQGVGGDDSIHTGFGCSVQYPNWSSGGHGGRFSSDPPPVFSAGGLSERFWPVHGRPLALQHRPSRSCSADHGVVHSKMP